MNTHLHTQRLTLALKTLQQLRQHLESMNAEDRAQVSPVWLERALAASEPDPWIHGFTVLLRDGGIEIGSAGFKGPPDEDGMVEIAYGIAPEHQSRGYATEAAEALTAFALRAAGVKVVRAHTLPVKNASSRVLEKCGFRLVGEVIDPEDGLVHRWETTSR